MALYNRLERPLQSMAVHQNPVRVNLASGAIGASGRDITVPSRLRYHFYSIRVSYTSQAGGTARRIALAFSDGTNIYGKIVAGLDQAGGTTYHYTFAPGLPDMTAVRGGEDDGNVTVPLSATMILPEDHKVTVLDDNGADATDTCVVEALADDLNVSALIPGGTP